MRRLALLTLLLALIGAQVARTTPAVDPALKTYLGKMGVQMTAYRAALTRADKAFGPLSDQVAITQFRARSGEFKRLAGRMKPIQAPRGLGSQHANMVKAVQTVGSAFAGFATARARFLKDKNSTALVKANTREHTRLRGAEKLEVAWARAVRARTLKAGLVVPGWLQDFFI